MSELYRTLNSLKGLESLLNEWPHTVNEANHFPKLNAWEAEDGLVVTAEVPGISPENLKLSVLNDSLKLEGSFPEQDEDKNFLRVERSRGQFKRELTLPYAVDNTKVKATCKNGILRLELPKRPTETAHVIEITKL